MSLFKIGLQLDGSLERSDRSRRCRHLLSVPCQVKLRVGIVGIDLDGLAKLCKRLFVIALAAERDSEHDMCPREFWVESQCACGIGLRRHPVCRVVLRSPPARNAVSADGFNAMARFISLCAAEKLFWSA